MASLIKNQLLKHLSKFTKNLSPDKIHLSTLKGEGDLSNLELDENILMELLDLPTWLRLTKATCNKVSIKVQWTKLKSQPICLYLDEVVVEMETCDEPRKPTSGAAGMPSYSSGGKYGFTDKVVDGMYLSVNSVTVHFKSTAFRASIQMSRLKVQSTNPLWKVVNDLRSTRIRDPDRGMVLTFKEIEWQTLRVEANAIITDDPAMSTTPLRLISNTSRLRITIKKKINDCSIVASKLAFILDDLLWVLTDSQMKAAITFVKSLRGIIEKSSEQSKAQAASKLQKQGHIQPHSDSSTTNQSPGGGSQSKVAQLFTRFDVVETSYHLYTGRIDLHVCDEIGPRSNASKHSKLVGGGAMQITLHKLSLDHYPYHPAGGSRKHWVYYNENMSARNDWAEKLMKDFRHKVQKTKYASPEVSPQHNADGNIKGQTEVRGQPDVEGQSNSHQQGAKGQPNAQRITSHNRPRKQTKLVERCFILRLEDFTVFRISTSDNKRNVPKKFVTSDKKQLYLPPEMSAVHAEYTEYYFPEGIHYPVPHSNLYVMINPIRLVLDYLTVLWLNSFSLNLAQNIEIPTSEGPPEHIDIKIDALMPRLLLPCETEVEDQPDRPNTLQIQASCLTMTNCRTESKSSLEHLQNTLAALEKKSLLTTSDSSNQKNLVVIPKCFQRHVIGDENASILKYYNVSGIKHQEQKIDTNALKQNGHFDIWSVCLEQVWLDFVGVLSAGHRPVPFVESFPLVIWLGRPSVGAHQIEELSKQNEILKSSPQLSVIDSPERIRHKKLLKDFYNSDVGDDVTSSVDSEKSATLEQHSNPSGDNQETCNKTAESLERLGDIHLLVNLETKVQCQLNHDQYLFLLRLIESMQKMQAQLDQDSAQITKATNGMFKVCTAISLNEVEVSLICPPIPECVKKQSEKETKELASPEEVSDIPQDLSEDSTSELSPVQSPVNLNSNSHQAHDSEIELDETLTSQGPSALPKKLDETDNSSALSNRPDTVISSQHSSTQLIVESHRPMSKETYVNLTSNSSAVDGTGIRNSDFYVDTPNNQPAEWAQYNSCNGPGDTSQISLSKDGQVSMSFRKDDLELSHNSSTNSPSRIAPLNSNPKAIVISGSEKPRSFSDLKKSLTNAKSKIGNALGRTSSGFYEDDDDSSDTVSLKSSLSEDEDDYVLVGLETTSESSLSTMNSSPSGQDGDSTSITSLSSAADKPRQKVSLASFGIKGIETILQFTGADISLKLQAKSLLPSSKGNVFLDELIGRPHYTTSSSMAMTMSDHSKPPINVSFKLGPAAEHLAEGGGERGFLDVAVENTSLHFMMSTLMNLAALFEDETIPEAIPMHVKVSDLKLRLEDDQPPVNSTSPGPVPIDLHIHKTEIIRTLDGTFHISPGTDTDSSSSMVPKICSLESKFSLLQKENGTLHKQINDLSENCSTLQEEISLLKKVQNDASSEEEQVSTLKREYEYLAVQQCYDQSGSQADAVNSDENPTLSVLREENLKLCIQVSEQDDEIKKLGEEHDSLMATLQLLQDELIKSEQMRLTGVSLK